MMTEFSIFWVICSFNMEKVFFTQNSR